MTCLKKFEASKGKSWSQVKKEREYQKWHSPSKKPRLSIFNNNNLFTSLLQPKPEVGSENEFSDDLPDIEEESYSPVSSVCNSQRINSPVTPTVIAASSQTRPTVCNPLSTSKPIVFDENARAKIADILTKVKKKCINSDSVTSKSCSQDRNSPSSPGNNRHFLDFLKEDKDSETCSTSLLISESPTSSLSSGLLSREEIVSHWSDDDDGNDDDDGDGYSIECHSANSSDDEWDCNNTKVHTFSKCGLLRQVRVPEHKLTSPSKQYTIKQFFPTNELPTFEHSESVFCKGKQVYLKQNRTLFPRSQIDEDKLVQSLSNMHINTIEAALEEGDAFLDYSLRLVEDFLLKPTESIIKEIISRGLLGDCSLNVVIKSGKLLSTILQKHPTLIKVEWNVIELLLDKLMMNKDASSKANLYPKVCLLLDLMCTCFQVELDCCKLSNPYEVRKTQAYKLLSSDCAFGNLKQIVQWIRSVINSDEYKELRDKLFEQHLNQHPAEADSDNVYVPKLLPNLQKLLEIGINVSRSCTEAAKRTGGEMVHIYMYLPDVNHKKLFLQSITCDLLQFKVVQRILEDNCDMTYISCEDFPNSLNDVIEAYFEALPPNSPMTPPQSPSDEENDPGDARSFSQFSTSSCEELALLVQCVTQSYLRCAQGYQHQPLSQRVRRHPDIRPLSDTVQGSQSLSVKVSDFYGHLVTLTTELNPATHQYLMLLQSMADSIS